MKLHGLELEHRMLLKVIGVIRGDLVERIQNKERENMPSLSEKLEQLIQEHLGMFIHRCR